MAVKPYELAVETRRGTLRAYLQQLRVLRFEQEIKARIAAEALADPKSANEARSCGYTEHFTQAVNELALGERAIDTVLQMIEELGEE